MRVWEEREMFGRLEWERVGIVGGLVRSLLGLEWVGERRV